ncbi:MAG: hypothetical protein ABFD07_14155 [Methanobacterium sp.]
MKLEIGYKSKYDKVPLFTYLEVESEDTVKKIMNTICEDHIRLNNKIFIKEGEKEISIPLWRWSNKHGVYCIYKFWWINILREE